MGWFGDLPMATAFAIVLGCLIAATFIAGFIKVCYNKRRLSKHEKLDELKLKGKGPKGADQEMLNTRETDEGDLFGVRALEAGYFGGVAQSRPSSPAGSRVNSYIQAPNGENSANSSTSELPLSPGLQAPKATKPKPSPLRLQPTDPDFRPPSSGGKSPSYMPLTGLSKSPLSATHAGAPVKDWVSPTDEQPPRPGSPASIASSKRPKSYLPKLNFPENQAPAEPAEGPSKIVERVIESRSPTTDAPGSPNSAYREYISSRGGRTPTRGIFPTESHRDRSSSRTRGPPSRGGSPTRGAQPSPLAMDNDHLPEHNPEWDNERPIVRDSIVSKKGVSVTTPTEDLTMSKMLKANTTNRRSDASSVYSLTNGAGSDWNAREQGAKVKEGSHGRTNSNSASRSRSSSSTSLAGARNSIRRSPHQRNASSKSNHRNSRDRDQIHYDPTPQSRNRSGSVQGRAVDFDQPRASPFSKAIPALPSHSPSNSVSSFGSVNPKPGSGLLSAVPPYTQDKGRLSVMSTARGRSDSEASQASMGDFYDAYYRQSTISYRASAYQPARPDSFTADLSNQSIINPGFDFDVGVTRKAPPPLGLKPLDVGETIVEVPSPNPTSTERFPSRV